jgi:hypothetical protein
MIWLDWRISLPRQMKTKFTHDCKSQYQLQMLNSVVPAAISVTTHADARLCLALSTWIYELGKEERESKAHVPFNHGISKHEENAMIQHVYEKYGDGNKVSQYFTNRKTGMQLAVFPDKQEERIYVVFRGTERSGMPNPLDSFINAQFFSSPISETIKVHSGYGKCLTSATITAIHESVTGHLQQDVPQPPVVWMCGHSMGGALASLYGYHFALKHPALNVKVITFGTPAFGNKGYRHACHSLPNLHITRICNNADFALGLWPMGYVHTGHLTYHILDGAAESDPCRVVRYDGYTYPARTFSPLKCYSFNDHHRSTHWRRLNNCTW